MLSKVNEKWASKKKLFYRARMTRGGRGKRGGKYTYIYILRASITVKFLRRPILSVITLQCPIIESSSHTRINKYCICESFLKLFNYYTPKKKIDTGNKWIYFFFYREINFVTCVCVYIHGSTGQTISSHMEFKKKFLMIVIILHMRKMVNEGCLY